MIKKELRSSLADGKTNQVLAELRRLTADSSELYNEVLQISAQFAENDRQRRLNITDPKEVGIERNRINSVIIIIIDSLPDDLPQKKGGRNWEKIALWVGLFAAVTGITGYTLKDFFNTKPGIQVEEKKENFPQNTNQRQSDEAIKKKNTLQKVNKAFESNPQKKGFENNSENGGLKSEIDKTANQPDVAEVKEKPKDEGLIMRIIELGTGRPIEGVSVQLTNSNEVVFTDKNGCFEVTRTIIDKYGTYNSIRAYFNKTGYESTKFEVPLSEPTLFKLKKIK